MIKIKSKKILIITIITVTILTLLGVFAAREYHWFNIGCSDIIGDGYYMGTDKEPVVIGNTCD